MLGHSCRIMNVLNNCMVVPACLQCTVIKRLDIKCVHTTSRRPCRKSQKRNGGRVRGVKYSFGD